MPIFPSPTLPPTPESSNPDDTSNHTLTPSTSYRPAASRQMSDPDIRNVSSTDPVSFVVDLVDTNPSPVSIVRRSASLRVGRLDPDRRGSSPRSALVPSPLADFQTNDLPNVNNGPPYHSPPPILPVSGPLAHKLPISALSLSGMSNGSEASEQRRTSVGTPTYAKSYNPFQAQGLESWTRESWGRRKIALISGITGQGEVSSKKWSILTIFPDGSYLTERPRLASPTQVWC